MQVLCGLAALGAFLTGARVGDVAAEMRSEPDGSSDGIARKLW